MQQYEKVEEEHVTPPLYIEINMGIKIQFLDFLAILEMQIQVRILISEKNP